MGLIFTNKGEEFALKLLVGATRMSYPLNVRLFKTDYTPTEETVRSSFPTSDQQSDQIQLPAANWGISTQDGITTATYSGAPKYTWGLRQGTYQTVYGYMIQHSDLVLWAERIASPLPIPVEGAELVLTPSISVASLCVTNAGAQAVLRRLTLRESPTNLTLRLFANDFQPSRTSEYAHFHQPQKNGYAAKTLAGATWSVATVSGTTTASYPEQAFTMTNDTTEEDIYGWFLTNSNLDVVRFQRFAQPVHVPVDGGSCAATPTITAE
jgi:hypothetical protein